MFNTIIVTNNNDYVIDMTHCYINNSTSPNDIVVVSEEMLFLIDANKINAMVVIIGSSSPLQTIEHFSTLTSSIKYLSHNYPFKQWWLIGSTDMIDDLIWNGAIMNVHIYKVANCESMIYKNKHTMDIINDPSCGFRLHSCSVIVNDEDTKLDKYSRTNDEEIALLNAMSDIIENGNYRNNRTGVATYSSFGKTFEYRMIERIDPTSKKSLYRFPLLTTKKMFIRGVFEELRWFLSGQTDSKILESQGVNIWKGNSSREYLDSYGLNNYKEGMCGPIYGHQWRSWNARYDQTKTTHIGEGCDQVANCINSLKMDPFGRRHIISGWNVEQLDEMSLPPCHVIYQFYVHEENNDKYLSLSMYQRSADTFLGVPFNICSMGLFLVLMAHHIGYKPYKLIHTIGDMHIYDNHVHAVTKQLVRSPNAFPFVGVACVTKNNIEDYEYKDIIVDGYVSHNIIRADMIA